jgi:hypothetical protein
MVRFTVGPCISPDARFVTSFKTFTFQFPKRLRMELHPQRDDRLWKIAMRRAAFKRHLLTYVLVNGFLWFIWWWGAGNDGGTPWPVYPTAGWGLGLAFSYFNAYGSDKDTLAQKEYERLRNQDTK